MLCFMYKIFIFSKIINKINFLRTQKRTNFHLNGMLTVEID